MDRAAPPDEVRLRTGSSLKERLIRAGSGILILLTAAPALLAWADGSSPLGLRFLWALPLGCFLVGVAALERNVAWIITREGVLIGQQRPLGGVRKMLIGIDDIADICLRKNRFVYPASFSLACRLASGAVLISPPLPDITRVSETGARVTRLLGLPDAGPVDNPLDAANAEIRLGRPLRAGIGRMVRMLAPVLAVLCCLPFLVALWIGEREFALGFALPLGLIAALALYRHAHRFTGTYWTVRHGEIRVERMAWNGKPSADTIRAGEVEAVEVGTRNSRHHACNIIIRLRTGRTLRSPASYDDDQARALRAEIIRRLGIQA